MTLTFRSTVVFDFNYPSVSAILLWPHCPLLSYRIKSCTGHSEDTNRLRGACKKRQSERWPKCGSGFGAAVLKTKLIQGHRLSEHAHFDKRTRTGLCDTEHIPKTPNNPVWSFKSSHENVNFISAFFIASSYFLLPSTGSKGYHGTGAHPSSHQGRGGKALWTGHQSILEQTHDPVTHLDWEAIYCVWTLGGNGENVRTPRWEAQSTERKTISPRGDHGNRCTSVPTCLKTTNNISMRWRWRNYQTH